MPIHRTVRMHTNEQQRWLQAQTVFSTFQEKVESPKPGVGAGTGEEPR